MARRPRDRVKPVFLSPMGFDLLSIENSLPPSTNSSRMGRVDPG